MSACHAQLWAHARRAGVLCVGLAFATTLACALSRSTAPRSLSGDWDLYFGPSGEHHSGFEAWRRQGFAHFGPADSGFAGSVRQRTGEMMTQFTRVTVRRDSVLLSGTDPLSLRLVWHGDTLVGRPFAGGTPTPAHIRLVRRATAFAVETSYNLWPGPVSDSAYAVTQDTAVFMRTRDGARLVNCVASPVGKGPFGVVMVRTPYRRILRSAGRYWASRGYIFVAQHIRGRSLSDGDFSEYYSTDVRDGYDAVEWAATLPGANGKVGLIGHSDEGRLAWVAATSAPPHLAAIAPSAASADPWRISPYEDMVFAPINVEWACEMRARTMQSTDAIDIGAGITRLPLIDLPRRLGCGDVAVWDRWIEHPTLDAFWRARAVTTSIANVHVPVLQISGWYDDARGPIDYTNALGTVPGHPLMRLVMGPGAHNGVELVTGEFGPQSRVDTQRLQLRWFDHYLLGKDNGVDREPPFDFFVLGDNRWRSETSWPLARAAPTRWYISSRGNARTSAGDGTLDTLPPRGAIADTFTYDPADPTPFLIDAAELETSLNEDYRSLNASRRDELVFTSKPLAKPMEVTGPMSATIWATSDARDTDWYVMLLDVFPDRRAERVQDGVMRARFRQGAEKEVMLTPGTVERYDIDLWFTSRVFSPGHRLRVTISSALFPKYDRNLNTGGNNERDTTFVVAHQTVLHDRNHPSQVVLPLVPR
jgi:uncharacterized protein